MTEANDAAPTEAWRFVHALRAACPGEFLGEPRPIQYGIKLQMKIGGYLIVWFRHGGFVSGLSAERMVPAATVLATLDQVVRQELAAYIRRPGLFRAIETWREHLERSGHAEHVSVEAQTASAEFVARSRDEPTRAHPDPIAAVASSGTIGVRNVRASTLARIAGEAGGPAGWSQAIGRRCERLAFEAICELCGDRCVRIDGDEARVRLHFEKGERILEWLNASAEQGKSWDIEERDVVSGEVLRRHEVKAPTAQLTAAEFASAKRFGANYLVWRVDPETGTCERLSVREMANGAQRLIPDESTSTKVPSPPKPPHLVGVDVEGATMVVLGSSTPEFCRRLRRQHQGFVGLFRGNLVVAFKVTPELEAQLPRSASKVWIVNRSRAGCERLYAALRLAQMSLATGGRPALLFVGVRMRTDIGTGRALRSSHDDALQSARR
jgi:hypothetical protein